VIEVMTEAEWLAGTDPGPMLAFLLGRSGDLKARMLAACRRRTSQRKLRLLAVAWLRLRWDWCWARRSWKAGIDDRCWDLLDLAERLADGRAHPAELKAAKIEVTPAKATDLIRLANGVVSWCESLLPEPRRRVRVSGNLAFITLRPIGADRGHMPEPPAPPSVTNV
jgi:hypothetical protein